MRYYKYVIAATCLLSIPDQSRALVYAKVEVPEYNANVTPQYATFSLQEPELGWGTNDYGLKAKCTIAIKSGPPKGVVGPTYYFELKGDSGGRCFGVRYLNDEKSLGKELYPLLQNVRVPYAGTKPALPTVSKCYGEFNSHYYATWNRAGWYGRGGYCTTAPVEVSCVVSVPTVIEHKPARVGVIRSSARGVANIRCTGKASVGLSSPWGIELYNGKEKVDSRLSLQSEGATAVIVVADPSSDVDLVSDINATQPSAGLYSGSGVLVASWD